MSHPVSERPTFLGWLLLGVRFVLESTLGGVALFGRGLAALGVAAARLWQVSLGLILPPSCRFFPSCSSYAIVAFERHGFLKGLGLTVWRLLRCHPWGGCGHDPVPDICARISTSKDKS